MVYSSFRLFCHHMIPVADSDLELGEKGEGGGLGRGGGGLAGGRGHFFACPAGCSSFCDFFFATGLKLHVPPLDSN